MTLTEFLLARVTEDERVGRVVQRSSVGEGQVVQILRECTAKREIVGMLAVRDEQDHEAVAAHATGLRLAVKALAAVYADHPDYREEWRP